MLCVNCGDKTDKIFMVNYISRFAVVCALCYDDISKKGK